jgi:hypothetical protein
VHCCAALTVGAWEATAIAKAVAAHKREKMTTAALLDAHRASFQ